uniref:Uncharacterized protein n=1 Tax=Fagus sylvatica TaxID=28930 RepID=A0A2N9IHA8_FAGSY
MGLTAMWWSHGGWVSRDGEGNGSRRMGFTGWGMVKGVGHGGGAMGWRGGGEVVIGGSSRRPRPKLPSLGLESPLRADLPVKEIRCSLEVVAVLADHPPKIKAQQQLSSCAFNDFVCTVTRRVSQGLS